MKRLNIKLAKKELKKCEYLWSYYSCDCLSYYMDWLEKLIKKYRKV